MKLMIKGYILISLFILLLFGAISIKQYQFDNQIDFLPTLSYTVDKTNFYLTLVLILAIVIFIIFSLLRTKDVNISYVENNKIIVSIISIILFAFSIFQLLIILPVTNLSNTFNIIEIGLLLISSISFLIIGLMFMNVIKLKTYIYYLLISPVLFTLLRLLNEFTSGASAVKFSQTFFYILYMCNMVIFLHLSVKFFVGHYSKTNKFLMLFCGVFSGFLGLFNSINNFILYYLNSSYITSNYNIIDFGLSIYAIVFVLICNVTPKILVDKIK